MDQRTIPQTPMIEGISGIASASIEEKARITAIMESSIRTDATVVIGKEDGNVFEEGYKDIDDMFEREEEKKGKGIKVLDVD